MEWRSGASGPVASMEPSTNVDGERAGYSARPAPRSASMEPSTNVDGECSSVRRRASQCPRLQWSRRRTSTERNLVSRLLVAGPSLQWSRRRTSTERRCLRPTRAAKSCRFNGAVDERRRRGRRSTSTAATTICFNGAVDERRRRGCPKRRRSRRLLASMEPSTNVDGEAMAAPQWRQ